MPFILNKPVMSGPIVGNVTCDLLSNIGWHCLSLVHCMEVSITSHITTTTTITTSFTCMTIIDKDKSYSCYPCDFTNKCSTMLQWNLDTFITKSQGTDKICLLKQGFVILVFFPYILLVYTKTVDSVFHALWLATQSVNILHYSLIHLQFLRASNAKLM